MNNKLEVIGIDHGWSMMKTISQVFVTGVKEITTTPALFGDVLEYEGKFYKVGTVRQKSLKQQPMRLRIERSPIARVPFISRSRRIRDYQDSSKTLRNQTLPSRPRTRIFTLQEELEHL